MRANKPQQFLYQLDALCHCLVRSPETMHTEMSDFHATGTESVYQIERGLLILLTELSASEAYDQTSPDVWIGCGSEKGAECHLIVKSNVTAARRVWCPYNDVLFLFPPSNVLEMAFNLANDVVATEDRGQDQNMVSDANRSKASLVSTYGAIAQGGHLSPQAVPETGCP